MGHIERIMESRKSKMKIIGREEKRGYQRQDERQDINRIRITRWKAVAKDSHRERKTTNEGMGLLEYHY